MQRAASNQHSLNNLPQGNLQVGNLSKSNSNQKTLFAKFVNLKLLTGSLLLLLLAACGGETSNNDKTGNNGDETPGIDKCKADNTIEGCSGYVAPIRNSYLTQDKLTATDGVPNFINRPNHATIAGTNPDFGAGQAIKEVIYGTIDELGKKFTPATFSNTFIEATTEADKKDDDKNNIIKISTGKAGESASDNYYYSHIGDEQFTQFLPAINKVEILTLNSELASEQNLDDIIFLSNSISPSTINTYNKLKDFVGKAKDYTFKGFALVGFSNAVTNSHPINEDDLYPANFSLTFNSSLHATNVSELTNNYFSMMITLDQEAAEATNPSANGATIPVASKPAVKTIEIKDFNFLQDSTTLENFQSYPSDKSQATNWEYMTVHRSMLAFSENDGKIEQIAGTLLLYKDERGINTQSHLKYMRIAYASNEVCYSGTSDAGTASCPKVQLTSTPAP